MTIISPLPYTLTNGTLADASQVMADLNQIVNDVNNNAQPAQGVVTTDAFGSQLGVATGVTIQELGGAVLHKTVITFTNVTIALAQHTTVGASKGALIYTMPKGLIPSSLALANFVVTKSSAGVSSTWSGNCGLGNVNTSTGDLSTSGESFWNGGFKSTIGPAIAGVQTLNYANLGNNSNFFSAGVAPFDVSTTSGASGAVYLNLAVNNADETVGTTPCNLIINGTLTLSWQNCGDY